MRSRHLFVLGLLVGLVASTAAIRYLAAPLTHADREPSHSLVERNTAIPAAAATSATLALPDNWPQEAATPEQVLYDQPRLIENAIARLKPQTPGKIDLYLLAFAGDGAEDVFRNEAEYATRLFARRFDAAGRTLLLQNNPATLARVPLASWSNLETALHALARVMDTDEDILFVYLASHGSEDHYLAVDMGPLPLDQIGADDLAGILAEQAFRWKVVVVNACYSGGFIPPLRGDGTLVMAAARSDRSSFGCGSESDITWFGDAFLAHALNHGDDFIAAFGAARKQITAWESRDGLEPSEPQIAIGAGIAAQLARWRNGIVPGAPLPFHPVPGDR